MKVTKILGAVLAAALTMVPAFAESPLTFSVQTDLVCNFKHDAAFVDGVGMPAGRVIPSVSYTIPTPLGENWLVSGATLVLGGSAEITPITVKPGISATFTPVPFLVFSAGADLGAGWNLLGMEGCTIGGKTTMMYKAWAQATFQFDTGAVVPGDWTHILMQYSYQPYYQSVLGAKSGDAYVWQGGAAVAALKEYQCAILAYQLPFAVYRVGAMYESDGYYGYAKTISVSPLCSIKISEKDNLNVIATIKSEPAAKRTSYLERAAFSWTHTF